MIEIFEQIKFIAFELWFTLENYGTIVNYS